VRIRKTEAHTDLCSRCDIRARLEDVPEEHRQAIRAAAAKDGEFAAISVAKRLLGWSLYDALDAIRELGGRD
jgi:hypothetical protein